MLSNDRMEQRMIDNWLLPNGLRVVAERLPYLRSVSIGVWLHVGSMMELPQENGLSHFLEHMVFKGTEKRTTRQIAEEMDAIGGQINAFTSKDCTCFYARVIDEDIALAVDVLADLTINATMDEGELKKERGVILEEIAMDEDSPEDLASDMLSKAQFSTQSLGMPILGPAEQVRAYTRDDLLAFRARHYAPRDCVVAICGNYEPEQLKALCEQYFGGWQNELPELIVPEQKVLTGQTLLRQKDIEQLHLCLGFPGAAQGTPELFPQSMLCSILGGSMSSRLFQRIREDLGMAYTIYSYTNVYQGCGTLGIYAGVNPDNGELVLAETRKELERLVRDGITDKEFRDAKTQLRVGFLMGLESSGGRMQSLGRGMLLRNRIISSEEMLSNIEAVTIDDVMDNARRILTVEPCLAILGPDVSGFQH